MGVKERADDLLEYILIHYRWVFVIIFLLPMSFIYQLWESTRSYVVFQMNSAPKMHSEKVKDVQKQIQKWRESESSTHLCTARPGWQTMSFRQPIYKRTYTNIRVNMVDVLMVNKEAMTVTCEPLVTMGRLSATLAAQGLALPVVPEIDDLTVGGLVMGTGVETSSHVYGLFQHICLSYELVLADGSVINCSKDENADIFYSVPWSYGTLGFLTSVVMQVIPAKKYVRLEYHPSYSLDNLVSKFTQESLAQTHQFVEVLLYNKESGVLMLADMVDQVQVDGKLNAIGNWYKPWFFMHVRDIMQKYRTADTRANGEIKGSRGKAESNRDIQSNGVNRHITNNGTNGINGNIRHPGARTSSPACVEYIPLRDYYHRHTRSLFWELQDIIPFGNNPLFRHILGWLMPPKVSLLKRTQTAAVKRLYERCHVIQDMLVPIQATKESLDVFHKEIEVYPVWLCPFKLFKEPGLLQPADTTGDWQMYVDIGVYGVPKAKGYETVKSIRAIEAHVISSSGYQMLYADTHTSCEEFRRMFRHKLYDAVRDKLPLAKKAFPEIYDKVCLKART